MNHLGTRELATARLTLRRFEIEDAENEKSALEQKMSLPEVYSNGAKAKEVQSKIDALAAKIDELNVAWEEAMEKLV